VQFDISNFEEYDGTRSLNGKAVLAWTKQEGYFFMTFEQARERFFSGLDFTIKGIQK
jgi:hypothetical protein